MFYNYLTAEARTKKIITKYFLSNVCICTDLLTKQQST